ncbi:MAG: ABC transporter substrate-binding protein [Candidatus Woesebacteria bacterium]|nr:MAG: ABC transporter substrate-binding protein [Candidatus Woesebacteria bacterium]
MANPRFNGVRPPSRPVRLPLPTEAAQPQRNQRPPLRPAFVAGIVFVVLCLLVSSVGSYIWFNRPSQPTEPTPTGQSGGFEQPTSVFVPGSSPTQIAIPTGPKAPVTIGFVYYVGYYEVPLMARLNNPYYQAVPVPFEFQAEENGAILTKGSESEQIEMLRNGEIDILLTTSDVLARYPTIGKGVVVWDRSHGVDQIWLSNNGRTQSCAGRPLKIFNDLGAKYDTSGAMMQSPCVIAVVFNSVSEYYALSYTKITGMTKNDITFAYYDTAAEAVAAFNNGEADAVACWEPDCQSANDGKSFKLTSTIDLHTIYDVILVSRQADQNKKPLVIEALADLFAVRNMFLADPEGTAELVAQWQFTAPTEPTSWWLGPTDGATYSTNWWTGVSSGTAYDDMQYWGLGGIAQAKFDHNLVYLSSPDLWWDNLELERKVWEWGGAQLETPFDPKTMVDTSYLQALSGRKNLYAPKGMSFLDNTFSPFPPEAALLPETTRVIAEYACPNVFFGPNATTIPQGSVQQPNPQYVAFVDCVKTLIQVMNEADVRIEIVGSAANPDPAIFGSLYAHCGELTDDDYCLKIAKGRANWAWNELVNLSFDMTRVTMSTEVGPRTSSQSVMSDSRFIIIRILAAGS